MKSSEQIVAGINRKDKQSFKYLYDAYYASLCHYARRFLGGEANEEDIVQEILVKLWEGDCHFESKKFLSAYLYRSVHNSCLFFLRSRKEKAGLDVRQWENILESYSPDQEELLLEEEYYRQIFCALEGLSAQRRMIVEMTMQGKKNEEIAGELHISINTVKTLKKKAYIYLRERLSPICWTFFLTFF